MRNTVSTGRSAASGGWRVLVLLVLLTLLHAALSTGSSEVLMPGAGGCPPRTATPAVSVPAERPCIPAGPVLASTEGGGKHPGSGVRRKCDASGCHLRHQVPTGAGGKALGDSLPEETITASGSASATTVVTAAAPASPKRVAILRC
ncbi:hypothetical protein G7Z12_34545 [Streptomyces sp. ID38640]|uniref:hypothetical protein n=1 Tax=Streptomyces sp. ID38640 TaxID=1265399 RepID=UPI00140EA39B|nr:hypothetical protein [Streptomyces sp. ID38640]QIK10423.1 hypothetical protein G7Z12_34545 [Streptomyces sp. ID38640]